MPLHHQHTRPRVLKNQTLTVFGSVGIQRQIGCAGLQNPEYTEVWDGWTTEGGSPGKEIEPPEPTEITVRAITAPELDEPTEDSKAA